MTNYMKEAQILTLWCDGSEELYKALVARLEQRHYALVAKRQSKTLTFKPSDFHSLPCNPMRVKR